MSPRRHREEFCESRARLSDVDFCVRLNVPVEKHPFVAATREALGRVCKVPAVLIYPEDRPDVFWKMIWDWDPLNVILELESILNVALDRRLSEELPPLFVWGQLIVQFRKPFIYRRPAGPSNVGEWTVRVADYLAGKLR